MTAQGAGRPALDLQASHLKVWSTVPGVSFNQWEAAVARLAILTAAHDLGVGSRQLGGTRTKKWENDSVVSRRLHIHQFYR
jgi:hypothetical protein